MVEKHHRSFVFDVSVLLLEFLELVLGLLAL